MSRRNGGIVGPVNRPVGGFVAGSASGVWRMNDVLTFVSNNQWPKGPENIENSCIFNDNDSPNLSRTPSSASSRTTWTWSAWIKRSNITGGQMVLFGAKADSSNDTGIWFESDETLKFFNNVGGTVKQIRTNALFRDISAWYHVVAVWDSSNSTAGDRMRLYINGVEVTSFGTDTNPGDGDESTINSTVIHQIGRVDSTYHFDGYMAEVVFVDGQALDASSFCEFNTASGIWTPKKIGQFANAGANSFYLNFKDSSNLGNDESGLNNDYTVGGITSLDQTTDTCVENFSTLNAILGNTGVNAFSEGNTVVEFTGGGNGSSLSTFGLQAGRWYAECKIITTGNGAGVGIFGTQTDINAWVNIVDGIVYANSGQKNVNGSETSSVGATFTDNDIIGVALDITSGDVEFFKNGSSQFTVNLSDMLTGGNSDSTYFFGFSDASGATSGKGAFNFGNPSFSISSGNSDANGFGNFEYAVPSGFYALNTSNLNTYG